MRGKRACTVRGGADGKGQLLYLAGGLLHSAGGGWKRASVHLASRLPDQINRLKYIKRSGYGRAKLDLLRQRVLAP